MFHFPAFPPPALYIQAGVAPHDWCGVSPFGNPRITVRLPTPRGISQATTSFFGSWCQGIHPVPLQTSTTENKDALVHCAVLKQRPGPPPAPTTTTRHPGQPQDTRADVEDQWPPTTPMTPSHPPHTGAPQAPPPWPFRNPPPTRLFPQDPTVCLDADSVPDHSHVPTTRRTR